MPGEEQEWFSCLIGLFIRILVEELSAVMAIDLRTLGSTTLNYPEMGRGAESDQAFYIQNQPGVVGRAIASEMSVCQLSLGQFSGDRHRISGVSGSISNQWVVP